MGHRAESMGHGAWQLCMRHRARHLAGPGSAHGTTPQSQHSLWHSHPIPIAPPNLTHPKPNPNTPNTNTLVCRTLFHPPHDPDPNPNTIPDPNPNPNTIPDPNPKPNSNLKDEEIMMTTDELKSNFCGK